MERWFGGYRSVLRHRDMRLLLGSLTISATGSWAYNVALLAFVFESTNSLAWVGAAGVARFVPALLLSPYAGVVAERTERVRLMVQSDVLCAAWQAGLAIVAARCRSDSPSRAWNKGVFLFSGARLRVLHPGGERDGAAVLLGACRCCRA
jgi:hypothetical protein